MHGRRRLTEEERDRLTGYWRDAYATAMTIWGERVKALSWKCGSLRGGPIVYEVRLNRGDMTRSPPPVLAYLRRSPAGAFHEVTSPADIDKEPA